MRVAVVGLGKLGAPLAAVLASKGNEVLGIDVNPEAVRLLNEGTAPVEERKKIATLAIRSHCVAGGRFIVISPGQGRGRDSR